MLAVIADIVQEDFNPRSREGSDKYQFCIYSQLVQFQSTLPRGERRGSAIHSLIIVYNFNPRSREGSDTTYEMGLLEEYKFQSTLPRGERLFAAGFFNMCENFNPRSREGSDPAKSDGSLKAVVISIHAPARGATRQLAHL